MDTDGINDPKPENGKSFPKEITLKYDAEPIVNLTKAISQQTGTRQKENTDKENISERQIDEQQKANAIYAKALEVSNAANKIADKSKFVNSILLTITIGVFIANVVGVNASVRAANAADSTYKLYGKQFEIINKPFLAIEQVEYVFPNYRDAPLTPGIKREMKFIIWNVGNHTVHAYRYKYCFKFDTSEAAINSIKKAMISDDSLRDLNVYIPPGRSAFSKNIVFEANPQLEDNERMKNGLCTFYLEMEYVDDITFKWRTYTMVCTLRAKGTQETMIDTTYENRNTDSSLNRPLPIEN